MAANKEPIAKPGTNKLAKYRIRIFITNANNPKVRIVIGKVKSRRIGFTNVLRSPKTNATIRAVRIESTTTPGIR